MRILVTGAAGVLGSQLMRCLSAAGQEPVGFDRLPMDAGEHATIVGDLRDFDAVHHAMAGCQAVCHVGALHGIHEQSHNENEFFHINVTGTHNVLQAMRRHNVRHLTYASSVGVYGIFRQPDPNCRLIAEDYPFHIVSKYYMTKQLSEHYCAFAHGHHGLSIAVLRYACFVPCDWKVMGLGRWGSFVDVQDAAEATRLALDALVDGRVTHQAFNVQPMVPFTRNDWPALVDDPASVFEHYYPGSVELLAHDNLTVPKIAYVYDISRARDILGYKPQHNLEQFFDALRQAV